jgi:hypothetical protein
MTLIEHQQFPDRTDSLRGTALCSSIDSFICTAKFLFALHVPTTSQQERIMLYEGKEGK